MNYIMEFDRVRFIVLEGDAKLCEIRIFINDKHK